MDNLMYIEIYSATVAFPALLVLIEFIYFLQTGQRLWRWGAALVEVIVLVIPATLLLILALVRNHRLSYLFRPSFG